MEGWRGGQWVLSRSLFWSTQVTGQADNVVQHITTGRGRRGLGGGRGMSSTLPADAKVSQPASWSVSQLVGWSGSDDQ